MNVIGFDIGGANTKATFMSARNGCIEKFTTASEYFPMWKNPENLASTLTKLAKKIAESRSIDLIAVTMTAELADVYETKHEGVSQILNQVEKAFPTTKTLILNVNANLIAPEEAKCEPLKVAGANWAATGWLISQSRKNCIVIDVGSTTTSIIPVLNGKVAAEGKTDLEKLVCGELVYTGSLRTNVAAIVNRVPIGKGLARVSSELFAQSADVHLTLGNISEAEYTVETTDGKEKTRASALARIARVVCADTEMLAKKEIVKMAQYVYERQIDQIVAALNQVCDRLKKAKGELPVVITGLGRNFLARKAAQQAGFAEIVDFGELIDADVARVSTAFAVALMGASLLERRLVHWTQ